MVSGSVSTEEQPGHLQLISLYKASDICNAAMGHRIFLRSDTVSRRFGLHRHRNEVLSHVYLLVIVSHCVLLAVTMMFTQDVVESLCDCFEDANRDHHSFVGDVFI